MSFLLLSLLATSTAVTARGQYVAGKQQEIDFKVQAEEEKLSAEAQELARRQELNKALAANVVGQSTSGISGEGSPASLSLASAKRASASEGLIGLSDRLKQAQLKRQGKNAKSQGYMAAGSTLLKGTTQAAKLGAFD